jgi:hypothetical protein
MRVFPDWALVSDILARHISGLVFIGSFISGLKYRFRNIDSSFSVVLQRGIRVFRVLIGENRIELCMIAAVLLFELRSS